jgi:hypothetical protein
MGCRCSCACDLPQVLHTSGHMQGQSVLGVTVRFYHNHNILVEHPEEVQQTLDGILPDTCASLCAQQPKTAPLFSLSFTRQSGSNEVTTYSQYIPRHGNTQDD